MNSQQQGFNHETEEKHAQQQHKQGATTLSKMTIPTSPRRRGERQRVNSASSSSTSSSSESTVTNVTAEPTKTAATAAVGKDTTTKSPRTDAAVTTIDHNSNHGKHGDHKAADHSKHKKFPAIISANHMIPHFHGFGGGKRKEVKKQQSVEGDKKTTPQRTALASPCHAKMIKRRSCMKGSRDLESGMKHPTQHKRRIHFTSEGASGISLFGFARHKKKDCNNLDDVTVIHYRIEAYTDMDLWWTQQELRYYQDKQEFPVVADDNNNTNKKGSEKYDDDEEDDELDETKKELFSNELQNHASAKFLCAYQVLRHQLHIYMDHHGKQQPQHKTNDITTTVHDEKKNFEATLREHFLPNDYQHFIQGIHEADGYGLERFVGADYKKRYLRSRAYVIKTLSYIKMMTPKNNTDKKNVKGNKNKNITNNTQPHDDLVYRMIRTYSEAITYQDRYWAMFVGHAVAEAACLE